MGLFNATGMDETNGTCVDDERSDIHDYDDDRGDDTQCSRCPHLCTRFWSHPRALFCGQLASRDDYRIGKSRKSSLAFLVLHPFHGW